MNKQTVTINPLDIKATLPLTARKITTMAMILAFRLGLSYIPSLRFGEYVRLGVGFVGGALSGIVLGPWWAMVVGIFNDLISFFLAGESSPFFWGYTVSAALGGFIYGFFFWRREPTWQRILLAVSLVTIFVNVGLGSLWVKLMTDAPWIFLLPSRLAKNIVSLPVNTIVLYFLFNQPTLKRLIKQIQF